MEDESAASLAASLVNEEGFDASRVFVLKEGLAGWEAAGLPTAMEPPAGS